MNTNLNTPSNNQYEGIDVFLSSQSYLNFCISKSIIQVVLMIFGLIIGIVLTSFIIKNVDEIFSILESFFTSNNIEFSSEFEVSSGTDLSGSSGLIVYVNLACMWILYYFSRKNKKRNWPFQVLYAMNILYFVSSCFSLVLLIIIPFIGGFVMNHLNSNLSIFICFALCIFMINIIIDFIYYLNKMKTFKKLDKGFIKEVEYIPEANKVKKTSYFKIGINLCQLISLIVLFNLLKTGVIFDNLSSLNIKELIELLKLFMPIINIFITFFIISKITNILSLLFDIKLINNYHYFVKNKRKININNTNNNEFDFI